MRWAVRLLVSLVVLLALTYGAAWLTTDRFGVSRALVWREADTADIDRFPDRAVTAGSNVMELPEGEPLDLSSIWPVSEPESFLEDTGTTAFLVVQDGAIRYEGYFNAARPDDLRTSFSVAKSVTSTLIGLAIAAGFPARPD
jgi:CubicO group peptidase (beta-lactamase class C family)